MASLKKLMGEKKVSIYKLAKDTGIAYSTLSDLVAEITPMENTSAGTLLRLAGYFGVSMESMLEKDEKASLFIYNEGRNVHLILGEHHIQYLGPKNLISFKKINCIKSETAYIDTYFLSDNGLVYVEEDYIDIKDLLDEYNIDFIFEDDTQVILGRPDEDKRIRIIDDSLLVSDAMAIRYKESSTEDIILEVTNLNRINYSMSLRLKDYTVLSTNMSRNMQKRAISSVRRNEEILMAELTEERCINA